MTPAERAALEALPKVELHLHLEGTIAPETLAILLTRHGLSLPALMRKYRFPEDEIARVQKGPTLAREIELLYRFPDFLAFLRTFAVISEALATPADYETIAYEMCHGLSRENVRYAEVFTSPLSPVIRRGMEARPILDAVFRGLERGREDFGVKTGVLFDAVRQDGPDNMERLVDLALETNAAMGRRAVLGIGIGGDEAAAPAPLFEHAYRRAKREGLRLTAHAGEGAGADSVRAAIEVLGVERIGHGIRALEDELVFDLVRRSGVTLDICPTSEVRTGVVEALESHPIRKFHDAGIALTVNTDDPPMFGATLTGEFAVLGELHGFAPDELRALIRHAASASFLEPAEKQALLDELDD